MRELYAFSRTFRKQRGLRYAKSVYILRELAAKAKGPYTRI
jgi:hypothetical protein